MLLYRRPEEQRVCFTISRPVLATLSKFIQRDPDDIEACGVLIARVALNGVVHVESVTEPHHEDQRKRSWFCRSSVHQKAVDRVFRESGQELVYCGEWHTHPERLPTPSSLDMEEWSQKLEENRSVIERLFFIIVGVEGLRAWEGCQRRRIISQLVEATSD